MEPPFNVCLQLPKKIVTGDYHVKPFIYNTAKLQQQQQQQQ